MNNTEVVDRMRTDPIALASVLWPEVHFYSKQIMPPPPRIVRFWKRTNKQGRIHKEYGQCWEWMAGKLPAGYGRFANDLAHRYSYREFVGEIPTGVSVLHKCDNPSCVNPDHLFLGTQQDNLKDMRDKGKQVRGERQGMSKLTEKQVVEIRRRYKRYSRKDGSGVLAKEYGVCLTQIYRVVSREHWRHV